MQSCEVAGEEDGVGAKTKLEGKERWVKRDIRSKSSKRVRRARGAGESDRVCVDMCEREREKEEESEEGFNPAWIMV